MPEFPSNSKMNHPPKTPEKIVEQVVMGEVTSRKKPLGRRLREIFIGGDSKSVVGYVFSEVLVPQAKDMLNEMVSTGFERLIYGENRPRRPGGHRPTVSPGPTNYTRYADRGNNPIGRHSASDRQPNASVRTQSIDDILFATRPEADTVVDRMYDILENYDAVTVQDLHSLIGWSSTYTDQKWGWTELHGLEVRRVRDGYSLTLPKTTALD